MVGVRGSGACRSWASRGSRRRRRTATDRAVEPLARHAASYRKRPCGDHVEDVCQGFHKLFLAGLYSTGSPAVAAQDQLTGGALDHVERPRLPAGPALVGQGGTTRRAARPGHPDRCAADAGIQHRRNRRDRHGWCLIEEVTEVAGVSDARGPRRGRRPDPVRLRLSFRNVPAAGAVSTPAGHQRRWAVVLLRCAQGRSAAPWPARCAGRGPAGPPRRVSRGRRR